MVLAILFACSSNGEGPRVAITGNWQWIRSTGGFAGTTNTPESTGDRRNLEISPITLKAYLNGHLELETPYTLELGESQLFNDIRDILIQENGFRQVVEQRGDSLFLIGDCNDCFTDVYIKG